MANLNIYEGENMDIAAVVTKDGVAVDLTGGTLYFIAKAKVGDPDNAAFLDLSSVLSAEIEVTDAAGGKATIKIVPGDTGNLNLTGKAEYFYELQFKDSAAKVYSLDRGRLIVHPSIRYGAL